MDFKRNKQTGRKWMEIMKPIKIKMDETEQDFCIKSFFKDTDDTNQAKRDVSRLK
jgi:hypothetical protein